VKGEVFLGRNLSHPVQSKHQAIGKPLGGNIEDEHQHRERKEIRLSEYASNGDEDRAEGSKKNESLKVISHCVPPARSRLDTDIVV
jgi:hypothetical protein